MLWYEPAETHFGLLIFSTERVNLLKVWSPVTAAIGNKQRRRRRQTRPRASKSKCFPWSEGWSQAAFKGAALKGAALDMSLQTANLFSEDTPAGLL